MNKKSQLLYRKTSLAKLRNITVLNTGEGFNGSWCCKTQTAYSAPVAVSSLILSTIAHATKLTKLNLSFPSLPTN